MIKVLVVDDSLFMRTLISDILNSDPEIEVVDTAKEGREALIKISKLRPDCITLDLAMPGWNGLTTLKHIIAEYPTPVVILSAHSKKDSDITMECLYAGAIGFVLKPSGELSLDVEKVKHQILDEVKAAAKVDVRKIKSFEPKAHPPLKEISHKPKEIRRKFTATNKIVIIGSSTGGPQTLELILSYLPVNFPAPIIVVQHIPSNFFSHSLAEHLNHICEIQVKVIESNENIKSGIVYLIPSGFRLLINQIGMKEIITFLQREEPDILTPSIDFAMKTIVEIYKENSIGIVLTGMGHDGVQGMKAIKEAGGNTIVQDNSSLIFGMPKAVIDAGYADIVLPAPEIPKCMVKYVS